MAMPRRPRPHISLLRQPLARHVRRGSSPRRSSSLALTRSPGCRIIMRSIPSHRAAFLLALAAIPSLLAGCSDENSSTAPIPTTAEREHFNARPTAAVSHCPQGFSRRRRRRFDERRGSPAAARPPWSSHRNGDVFVAINPGQEDNRQTESSDYATPTATDSADQQSAFSPSLGGSGIAWGNWRALFRRQRSHRALYHSTIQANSRPSGTERDRRLGTAEHKAITSASPSCSPTRSDCTSTSARRANACRGRQPRRANRPVCIRVLICRFAPACGSSIRARTESDTKPPGRQLLFQAIATSSRSHTTRRTTRCTRCAARHTRYVGPAANAVLHRRSSGGTSSCKRSSFASPTAATMDGRTASTMRYSHTLNCSRPSMVETATSRAARHPAINCASVNQPNWRRSARTGLPMG